MAMSESWIEFHGDGPFDLPVAQAVSAEPQGEHVLLTLRVLVRGGRPEPVRVVLLGKQVPQLLAELSSALAAIEQS